MTALHPAGGVGNAEEVLRRPLRDAAFAVPREAGHRETGTPVVDRIGAAREIPQTDVADPVAAIEADGRVQVVRIVVAESDFVDDARCEDPCVAGGEIPSRLRQVRVAEHTWVQLRALVIHEPLKEIVAGQDLIAPHGGRVRVVAEIADRPVVVRGGIVRRRDSRRQRPGKVREATCRNHVSRKRQPVERIDDRRRDPGEIAGKLGRAGNDRKERLPGRRSQPLIASEREDPVSDDRTAGREAGLGAIARLLPEVVC